MNSTTNAAGSKSVKVPGMGLGYHMVTWCMVYSIAVWFFHYGTVMTLAFTGNNEASNALPELWLLLLPPPIVIIGVCLNTLASKRAQV